MVADDATKMYAKSIEDADRFDNVKDWQKEVELVMKERKIDPSVRTPELEVSAKKLVNKEISREEHLRSIDKHKPVRSFDKLPRQPKYREMYKQEYLIYLVQNLLLLMVIFLH